MVVAAALIAAAVIVLERVDDQPEGPNTPNIDDGEVQNKGHSGMARAPSGGRTPSENTYRKRAVAMIIDDIGYDLQIVEELARIPLPVAYAVLPNTPHAAEAAKRLHAAGKEVLLHLPMEPLSHPEESPGEGALMTDMDAGEIRRLIRKNLGAVPFVSGVNNHMGSRFMEDRTRLSVVMEELRERNLYFVDSMTTDRSQGRDSAMHAGVRFASRDVFIDYAPGYATAFEALKGASRHGRNDDAPLLMIGHPHAETVQAIHDILPVWRKEGVKVVSLSSYFRISGGSAR